MNIKDTKYKVIFSMKYAMQLIKIIPKGQRPVLQDAIPAAVFFRTLLSQISLQGFSQEVSNQRQPSQEERRSFSDNKCIPH